MTGTRQGLVIAGLLAAVAGLLAGPGMAQAQPVPLPTPAPRDGRLTPPAPVPPASVPQAATPQAAAPQAAPPPTSSGGPAFLSVPSAWLGHLFAGKPLPPATDLSAFDAAQRGLVNKVSAYLT